ncbi:MAG: hypothetical protein SFU56_07015 [Capsulimonadales bacterium]|nr:hypothetical protein [Capsulimonadales bacterium]
MVLICAATAGELTACPDHFLPDAERRVTGVGIPATFEAFFHDLTGTGGSGRLTGIVNIGIAGAYPETELRIGDIVVADGDTYGDIGMELPDEAGGVGGFLPVADTPFGREFYSHPLPCRVPDALAARVGPGGAGRGFAVRTGRGCTVNACTGTETVGRRRAAQTGAIFETMEGAAVCQIGRAGNAPVCQIRAISNIAARREMRPENIRLALANLHVFLSGIEEL